jgi:hypothetical protein
MIPFARNLIQCLNSYTNNYAFQIVKKNKNNQHDKTQVQGPKTFRLARLHTQEGHSILTLGIEMTWR